MMFWIGFCVGMFVGSVAGFVAASFCQAARMIEDEQNRQRALYRASDSRRLM